LKIKVAVVGIGAIGGGLVSLLRRFDDMEVVAVADRSVDAFNRIMPYLSKDTLTTTDPLKVLLRKPDVLVEATGSLETAILVSRAIDEKIHVILVNSELDQIFGLLLSRHAIANGVVLTSDAGDQPGVLARLIEDVSGMGFEVVMAGNNKGFLDRYANPQSIEKEAAKRHLSLKQCAAYTDGTKLAIEMALVANGFGYDIFRTGMIGPTVENVEDALHVFDFSMARQLGGAVDYVLGARPGGSVFIIGYSDDAEIRFYMDYYKMGSGPYYLFMRPYHLCHFETPYAIRRIMEHRKPILVQRKRVLEVGCRAKTDLRAGTKLDGIGGYHLYGLLEKVGGLPIGLAEGAVLLKPKKRDETISWDDVELPHEAPLMSLWRQQASLED